MNRKDLNGVAKNTTVVVCPERTRSFGQIQKEKRSSNLAQG